MISKYDGKISLFRQSSRASRGKRHQASPDQQAKLGDTVDVGKSRKARVDDGGIWGPGELALRSLAQQLAGCCNITAFLLCWQCNAM
jgi:hypothetical protein